MKILLTGATGYIGKRLLFELVEQGHEVICCVRDIRRFQLPTDVSNSAQVIEVDFLNEPSLDKIPKNIDGAYYLIHSLSSANDYEKLELEAAGNFREVMSDTLVEHVIYLSELISDDSQSKFLRSRQAVEVELAKGDYHFTSIRAGVVIGSGSSSFEIIRDIAERRFVMIVPRWFRARCQPIGIMDVLQFLSKTLFNPGTFDKNFDIGGPEVVTYANILVEYARARGLKRKLIVVPLVNLKISSYWLTLASSVSYKLAKVLITGMKEASICRDEELQGILDFTPITYEEALQRTLVKVGEKQIISSWRDSWVSGRIDQKRIQQLNVPTEGCLVDKREIDIVNYDRCLENIWRIGGEHGWYFADPLWKIRGLIDKILGGVGLRRGRTHPHDLSVGDAIDFWRVLYANKKEGRLLLFAEMKIPGEAWLEFTIEDNKLHQVATFLYDGFWGRVYWYALLPIHLVIFRYMIKRIAQS